MNIRLIASLLALAAAFATVHTSATEPFWLGGDISATTEMESNGEFSYTVDGVRTENTELMKQYGMNAVRLRVWVDPRDGWSSKEDVLEMAKRAKALGMAIMIDFHYSDWWADPGKQRIPHQWAHLDYEGMKGALADHTRQTLKLLRDNDIDVKWVQVGNETSNGFLWPIGRASDNMAQYAGLTQAGYDAVKEIYPDATVIVHLDNGFDQGLYDWIFDGLKENGAKWDMIGMSLYPYWAMMGGKEPSEEKTLDDTINNIKHVAKKYGTDVMIVEIGVLASDPIPGKAFVAEAIRRSVEDTDGHCKGVIYWAPECSYGYQLGAFQHYKPTVIMDAFKEANEKYNK